MKLLFQGIFRVDNMNCGFSHKYTEKHKIASQNMDLDIRIVISFLFICMQQ